MDTADIFMSNKETPSLLVLGRSLRDPYSAVCGGSLLFHETSDPSVMLIHSSGVTYGYIDWGRQGACRLIPRENKPR